MLIKPKALFLLPALLLSLLLAACGDEVTPTAPASTPTSVAATATTVAAASATAIPPTLAPATAPTPSPTTAPATPTLAAATPTAPPATATTQSAPTGGTAVTAYTGSAALNTIASASPLDIPRGDAFLSPDGKRIAWTDLKEICIYQLDGSKGACGTNTTQRIDANSIRWSPDSSKLVFTENFLVYFYDPDIWLMDAASGKTTDLTDDGTDAAVLSSKPDAKKGTIDLAPRWTADGTKIIFVRNVEASESSIQAQVFTISPDGGAPELLGKLNSDGYATYSIDLSPDGTQLLYNVDQGGQPRDGLWLADSNGQHPRKVFPAPGPRDVSFSADGAYALGLRPDSNRNSLLDEPDSLVVTRDGDEVELDPATAPQWSAWAPDGSAMAYIVKAPASDEQAGKSVGLFLTDRPGQPGRQLLADSAIFPPHRNALYRGFDWAANNTMIVMRSDLTFELLQLGADPHLPTAPPVPSATPASTPAAAPTRTVRPTRTARPTETAAATAQVDELDIPFGDAFLSPDGQQIAWTDGKQLCFYAAAGTKGECVNLPAAIDRNTLRWSPDSSKLVFTEDWARQLLDPDIWVVAAASGDLTNLTDDGVDKIAISGDTSSDIDITPRWNANGDEIYFIRTVKNGGVWQGSLYSIAPDGIDPHLLGRLPSATLDTFALALAPDGSTVAYNAGRDTTPEGGLLLANADGSDEQQLLPPPVPANIEYSADGQYVMTFRLNDNFSDIWSKSSNRIVDLSSGDELEVDPDHAAQWAGFAPDSNRIVYISHPGLASDPDTTDNGVYVNDGPGEAGALVLSGDYIPPYRAATWRTLEWSAANTVLLLTRADHKYVLLHMP